MTDAIRAMDRALVRRSASADHRAAVMAMGEAAALVFSERGWTYHDGPPTVERLADVVWANIAAVVASGGGSCLSGRFEVEMAEDHPTHEDGDIIVSLQLGDLVGLALPEHQPESTDALSTKQER